jgi:hypothetical protein
VKRREEKIAWSPATASRVIPQEREHGPGGVAALELDIDQRPAIHGVQHLAEKRDAFPLAGIQGPEVGEGVTTQEAGSAGGAIEPTIMDDEQLAIDAMDIDLDAIHAKREGAPHGAEGILRLQSSRATMTDAKQGGRMMRRFAARTIQKIAGPVGIPVIRLASNIVMTWRVPIV